MKLNTLFHVINGLASSEVTVLPKREVGCIPYIRPSSTQQRTVAGWVKRDEINSANIFPSETIFVSTDGEGSHTYAYVSQFDFVPNSNVSVLIPNFEMNILEKLFYTKCITMNRYKFSYGRKPKGNRLKSIELPETTEIPAWVYNIKLDSYCIVDKPSKEENITLDISKWRIFKYKELFFIERGRGPRKKELNGKGKYPFVSASEANNGITDYSDLEPYHKPGVITVARNGNSVASAFYQEVAFHSTEDVHVFTPKFTMNKHVALFICVLIQKERYRYSYGRKWGLARMNETDIKLPVNSDNTPDWDFMDRYINSLPYSSQLHVRAYQK